MDEGARHAHRPPVMRTILVGIVLVLGAAGVASVATVDDAPPGHQAGLDRPVGASSSRAGAPHPVPGQAEVPAGEPRPSVPRGEPTRVVVPAIDVDVVLVPLGLQPDRAMEVPDFGSAGWYAKGPRPGHPGPAVLAGHVDSRAGPDVFFDLRHLAAGDRIHVLYDSGDRATFVVTGSERTPKEELPVASIWPVTNERRLALITCAGTFDRDARSYRDNLVVYALPLDAPVSASR